MDLEPVRKQSRSEAGPGNVPSFRVGSRVPTVLSVGAIGLVLGLLVGVGFGFRLGQDGPTPVRPTATPTGPDLQPDAISPRLELAFQSEAADGWAVCDAGGDLACHDLVSGTTDMPREPSVRFGEGWYASPTLTRVHIGPAHDILGATLGDGSVLAFLNEVGPGDDLLRVDDLTPVSPGRHGQFFFDLGSLQPGHYVVQVDFIPVPPAEGSGVVTFYLVGFVVS